MSADYYTLGIHNPAVVQRVMRDAFVYMKKYHDIELIYYLPRIHGGLDLQARITQAVTRTGTVMFRQRGSRDALQLHPSWNGYISMVGRKNEKKKRGGSATPNPGEKCLTMLISKQEREYVVCVCVCVCVCAEFCDYVLSGSLSMFAFPSNTTCSECSLLLIRCVRVCSLVLPRLQSLTKKRPY